MEDKLKYYKNCSKCGCEQRYKNRSVLNRAIKLNTDCNKCSHIKFKNKSNMNVRKKINEIDIEKIKDLYIKNKLSCDKIGKLFNTSRTPIAKILKDLNLLKNGKSNGVKIVLSEEQEILIRNMYLFEYKNTTQIAEKLLLSPSRVSLYLVNKGYKRTLSEGNFIGKIIKFHNISPEEYLKKLPEYVKYRRMVDIITRKQPIETLEHFNLRGNYTNDDSYHLDHKYSVLEGFKNGIAPEIIGNIRNLEFIPWKENQSKSSKCSITIEELINNI